MHCYLCQQEGAKRSNIIETDDSPKEWLKRPQVTSKHCVCDECMADIEEEMDEEEIESIYD